MTRRWIPWTITLALPAALTVAALSSPSAADEPEKDAALERTRKQVRMLDDLYKTAVVLVTDKYVHSKDDFPAGGLAVRLFSAMKEKGWHEVRLLDATGDPLRDKNAPKDEFEKEAIAALKAGESGFERVVESEGKRILRSATPIPVVSKKCIYCHEQYEDAKEGEPIGALGYTIEIE